jgi:hypothetical protein
LRENFDLPYDAILGKDFLETKESVTNYCSCQIIMNDEVIVNFGPKPTANKTEPCRLTLRARTKMIVRVPTSYKGTGLLPKSELLPVVYLASSLTSAISGVFVTSIINMTETDQTVELPRVFLESLDKKEGAFTLTFSAVTGGDSRIFNLRNRLRLDHVNSEERTFLVTICEKYNDIFHIPGDKLTCTSIIEHAFPTPSVDPRRAINVRPYRIPEVHKEEVQRQKEQMLADGVIPNSISPWNFPILVVPKKTDASGKIKWILVVGFRKQNDVTIGDSFPIPLISEVLNYTKVRFEASRPK